MLCTLVKEYGAQQGKPELFLWSQSIQTKLMLQGIHTPSRRTCYPQLRGTYARFAPLGSTEANALKALSSKSPSRCNKSLGSDKPAHKPDLSPREESTLSSGAPPALVLCSRPSSDASCSISSARGWRSPADISTC